MFRSLPADLSHETGIYILRDDLHLATPLQSSEIPVLNPNPLATIPGPPTTGVKLSLSVIRPYKISPQLYKLGALSSTRSELGTFSIKESEYESRNSREVGDDSGPRPLPGGGSGKAPAFGEGNSLLNPVGGKDGLKRRKPKNNIAKSNSSLIARVFPHEAMSKRLQENNPESFYVFANINRAFQWLDLSCTAFSKVTTADVLMRAHADVLIRQNTSSRYCSVKPTCCVMTSTCLPKAPTTSI